MKAVVVVDGADRRKTLVVKEVDPPQPGPCDLLISVRAAGLNRADLQRVQQHFALAPGAPHIAGLELSGEVIGMGAEVRGFARGDRVMSMASGAYAEQAICDYRTALKAPKNFSWVEAAATPTLYLTTHDALITNGRMQPGDNVLIQAVSSGVGVYALQLAKLLGAGKVLGTSRSTEKIARLKALGLDVGINPATEDVAAVVKQAVGDAGVQVVLDSIGGGVLATNMAVASLKGRIVQIGRMGGINDQIDLNLLAFKRLQLIGVTFRSRTIEEKAAINAAFLRDCASALESGALKPIIDRTYLLEDVLAAQELMRSNVHLGKIVLTI